MINQLNRLGLGGLILLSCVLLYGCSEPAAEIKKVPEAVMIHHGEECDLCGMLINQFSGPKGQLFERGRDTAKKFCSTRDLFAYALQPEHQHRVNHIYVHDVASAPWDNQSDAVYVDAKSALFVIGHKLQGAMGATLASFAERKEADAFIERNGGRIVMFEDIDLTLLTGMNKQVFELDDQAFKDMNHHQQKHSH